MSEPRLRLFIRREARADLEEVFAWYEARSRGWDMNFLRAIRIGMAAIERSPDRFPVVAQDIRKVVLSRFPYGIFFVTLPRHISVIAVMHMRRHPRRWRSRR